MTKIRKDFLESLNVSRTIGYDNLIKDDIMMIQYSEGLYFSEINYLTYDELVFLYNNEQEEKCKNYLLQKIEEANGILDKYNICLTDGTYESLSPIEENRILILLGFKTIDEVFPDYFNKNETGFYLSEEELLQKSNLINNMLIKRMNNQRNLPFITMYKYAYIYYSMNLFLKYIKDDSITSEEIWNEEKIIFENISELLKIMIRPTRGDINTLHVRYMNEKNKIYKFMYYHMILDSSDEQKFVNELFSNKELDKLDFKTLGHFYMTGGGTPFILNNTKKVNTIHTNVLDELLMMLKENIDNSSESNAVVKNNNIIKFPKK